MKLMMLRIIPAKMTKYMCSFQPNIKSIGWKLCNACTNINVQILKEKNTLSWRILITKLASKPQSYLCMVLEDQLFLWDMCKSNLYNMRPKSFWSIYGFIQFYQIKLLRTLLIVSRSWSCKPCLRHYIFFIEYESSNKISIRYLLPPRDNLSLNNQIIVLWIYLFHNSSIKTHSFRALISV